MPGAQVRRDRMNDAPDFCQTREPFSPSFKLMENIVTSLLHGIRRSQETKAADEKLMAVMKHTYGPR